MVKSSAINIEKERRLMAEDIAVGNAFIGDALLDRDYVTLAL